MTAPVPEERNDAEDLDEHPPGEHSSDLPDGGDDARDPAIAEENAETSLDQPSQ